jgi:nitrogen regulatory protein P-II 1
MKRIEAVIKPFKLEEVRGALAILGISDITVSEVQECGWGTSRYELHRGKDGAPAYSSKIKLEFVVPDALSGPISAAIVEAAITRSIDDGHIFIS